MARSPAELLHPGRPLTLAGVADGAAALVVADLARAIAARADAPKTSVVVVCRDAPRMGELSRALEFFAPEIPVLEFPAWDCLPYDRVSPHPSAVAQRMLALSRLARSKGRGPSILLTTVNAALQRVPPRDLVAGQSLSAAPGNVLDMDGIVRWLALNGFNRASTVRDPGEYAVRGGIIDLFAPGMDLEAALTSLLDECRRAGGTFDVYFMDRAEPVEDSRAALPESEPGGLEEATTAPMAAEIDRDESEVRAAIQRVFDQLKSGQYEAVYDGLPSSTRARITKDRFVSALRRTQNLYQLDRIEIGAIRVSGNIAVADTTMYAHLGKPFDTDGKLVVQQYLISEVYGRWAVATGNKVVIAKFLNANPSFARKFPIKKPRAFINRDGAWIEIPFGQRGQ